MADISFRSSLDPSRYYIVDHHHLVRALHDEGVNDVLVTVLENLSGLTVEAFWSVLDNRSLIHPFDAEVRRQTYDSIPRSVRELIDDPFRSLAGELRRVGGFAMHGEFFSAEFLRRQIDRKLIERDFRNGGGNSSQARKVPSGKLLARLVRANPRRMSEERLGRPRSPVQN